MSDIVYIHNFTLGPNGTPVESSVTSERHSSSDVEVNVLSDILQKYYSIFLVCFGTIGNGLSLAVLSRKTFRSSPIGIYLICLALSDLTALYTGPVYFWALAYFNFDMRNTSAYSCRFHRWISYTAVDTSSWILILVTVARLISILYPLKTICTRVVAYISLVITVIAAFAANLPMFIFYGNMKTYPNGAVSCRYFSQHKFFIKSVWHWIVLVKFGFLPVVILIILNTILCIRVFRSSREMKRMNNNSYIVHESPNRRYSSRFGYYVYRVSGRRLMKNFGESPHNLNVSNTDITKITTTGDMATSLLQSTEDIYRRSAVNSRFASTEELRKELNETYGICQENTILKSNNEKVNSLEKDNRKHGNSFIRFAKQMFQSKIRKRKSKSTNDDNDSYDATANSLKETRALSTASEGDVLDRTKSSSRSLCYDSRNSFHFARDSLDYAKNKRKIPASKQETEELISSKTEDAPLNIGDNNQPTKQKSDLCNIDPKRPTPIFTISSPGGEAPSHSIFLSDVDTGVEISEDPCCASKYMTNGQESKDEDSLSEQSEDETDVKDNSEHCVLRNRKESESSKSITKNKNQPSLNTSSDQNTLRVTDNLKAASLKLQQFSQNQGSDFTSTIPLHKLNTKHSSQICNDSLPADEAGSDSSRRSTGLLVEQHSNSNPSNRTSPGRVSPCIVSNGLLKPRGQESQLSGSRQSLNASAVRGRSTTKGKAKTTRNLTATLLVINLVFIICNIPIVVYMTSRNYLFAKDRSPNSPGKTFEIVSNFIMYTNNAANFIMYCLTGTRFRGELKALFKEAFDRIRGRRKKRQIMGKRR